MGNISLTEIVVVLVVALLVFGPRRLPEIARAAGRAMQEYRQAARQFQADLQWDDTQPAAVERLDEGTAPVNRPSAPEPEAETEAGGDAAPRPMA